SNISSSGGPPTPAFHIPQDLITTDQPHCQRHNDPNDHDPPCTQSLGKFIHSFEPHTQTTTNMKQKLIPTKHFIYQPFKNWLARFLKRAGIMEILHQHQQSQTPTGSPKCDVWDGLVWRRFTGTRNINAPHSCPLLVLWPSPFMWTGLMHMESKPG
ncbi:hypothetical protein O181_115366, partial [Austropuccinia psidii MF-1]|nr:hypothetical protein [Austropuccinia psidii MF-1]